MRARTHSAVMMHVVCGVSTLHAHGAATGQQNALQALMLASACADRSLVHPALCRKVPLYLSSQCMGLRAAVAVLPARYGPIAALCCSSKALPAAPYHSFFPCHTSQHSCNMASGCCPSASSLCRQSACGTLVVLKLASRRVTIGAHAAPYLTPTQMQGVCCW